MASSTMDFDAVPDSMVIPAELEVKRSGVSTKNGVWCKRSIPKGVKYGPFKGEKKKKSQVTNPDYMWEIRTGKGWFCVDASDPSKGNWMRYVNSARYFEEQNIVALQQHQRIYYKTIKEIKPGEELLCWFNSADTAQQELAMEHAGKPKAKKKSKSSKIFGKVVKKRKGKQGKGGKAAATSIKSSSSQEDLTADTSVEETTLDESEAKTDDSQEADTGTELSEETAEETSMDQESETPDEDDLPIAVLQKQQQATPRKKEEEETSDDEKLVIDEEVSGDAKDAESGKDSESAKHVSPKPFPCTQCGRNFSTKQGLERHLRTHSGEKPYKCSHCGKQFTTSTNMRRHERLHTGDRPHVCQECDHAFIQKGDLKKHMLSQHGKVEADSVEESEKDGQENGSSPQSSVCLNKSDEHPESSKEPTPTKDGQSDAEKEPEDEPSGDMMSEIVGDTDKQELDDENEMEEEEGKTGKFICEICNKRFTKYPNMTRHRKLAHERDQIIRKKKILVEELLEEGERPKKRKRVSQGDSPRSRSSTPGAHPGKGEDAAQYLDGRLEQKEHQHIGKLSPKRIVDGSSSKKKSPVRSGGHTVKIHVPRAVRPPTGTPGRGPRHGKSSGMHPGAVSPYTQVHPGSSQQGAAAVHITSPPYGSPQYMSGKGRRMLEPPPAHSGPLVPPHQSSSNRRTDSPPLRSPIAKQSQGHRDQQLSRMLHPESRGRDRAPPNVVVGDQQLSPMHRQKQRARAPAPPNVVMAQRASFLARGAAGAGPRKGVPSPHARNMAAPQQEHPKQSTSRTPTIAQVAKHSPALQKMYAASFPDRMVSPSQNIRSQQLSYLASRVGTVHHGSNAKGSFGQSTPTLQQFQSTPSNQYSSSSQGAKMPSALWSKGKSRDTQPYRMKSSPELYSHMVESDQPLDLSAPLKKAVKEELVFTDDGVLDLSGKKQVDRPPAHTARQQLSSLDLSDASSVASYISRVPQYEKASSYVSGSSPANAAAGRSASPTFGLGNLFKCNVCHTPFKSMKDMNQHVSVHAKEWPFKCEFCIQLFKVSSELSQHRASLHGVSKTFMCSLCNREFGFLGNLQNHQRDVHPNMPCSYTVLQPGALRPQNFTDPSKSTPKKEELKRQTEFGSLIQSPKKDQVDGKGKISPVKPVDTSQDIKRNFAGYAMNIINPENPFNRPPQLQTSLYNSAIKCTKCGATFESMPNLHMHIIDCAEGKKTSPGPSPVKKGSPKKAAHGSLVKKLGEPHKLTDGEMAAIKIKKKAKNLSKLNEKRKKAQQFQISYDPKKYTGRRRLATEMLDLHKCPGCQKNFSHFSNLQRHLLVCPGKDKIDKDVLDAHLGALKEDEKSRELKEQHMCSNCKRSFTYLASLRKHQQSCDKKFAAAAEGRADTANAGAAVPGLKKKRSKGRKLAPVDGESTEDSMLETSETEDTGLEEYGETFEEGNAPPTKKKRVIGWKGGRRKKRNFWWKKKRSLMKGEDGMEEADSQGNGESSQILNIMRSMSDELQSPTEQPEGAPFGNGGEPLIQGEEEAGMPGPGGDYNEEMKVFDAIEGIAKKVSGGKESSTKAGAGKNNGANSNNNNNNARGNRVVRTNVPSASTAKVEVGQGDGATGAAAKPSTSQGPFICGDCGSEFRAKCHLVRHSSVHMNRPYKCKICHHSFAAQHNFENHMRLRHKNVTVKVEKS
ncbi:PRDM2 [Branchiostoma lanceolatum]|uniref:PRDM2 protein n=1 Tax=Branchiostoma lanceolatum TaxID=7740 RepID=A0A8J9YRE0_BRALA|nr:PRDM2 [Branchiostoma lanceolatum]